MSQIQPSRPSVDGLVVIPGLSFTQCGAINASQACTADITFASGHVLTSYPLVKGYNKIQATKADNISAGTLVALYNEGAGEITLPPALVDLYFKNGIYSIKGVANSFAAVLTTTAYGPFNPAHIVAGVGWVVQAGAGGADDELQLTPGAFATLNGQPITVVMEHEIITPGGQSRSDTGAVISYASDDLNTGWQVDTNPAFTSYSPPVGAIGLKDESGGNLVINTTGLVSKLATLFGPNQISASNNGAATQSLSPSVQPAPTLFMIDNYAEKLDLYVVRRVTIYPAVAPASLPGFSAA